MKIIAFTFLTLFSTFTVVLSTYFLWQGNKVLTMLPVEEEDHGKNSMLEIPYIFQQESILFDFVFTINSTESASHFIQPFYEDVLKNTPYSPPEDKILC